MANKETILVTGAAGFIGGRIVEALHLSCSGDVRAGIRQWTSVPRIGRFPIEMVPCDVMKKGELYQAMDGVITVIHCAVGGQDVTIQGTKNVLDIALKLGVERFVHLSTVEVYGDVGGEIDETHSCQRTATPYTDAKIEAEQLCWEYHKKGLPVTVIRPTIVYGPFSKLWTVRFAERLQCGNWGIFKNCGEGICNLIYIDDLVSAILLAATHQDAVGEAFNINGPEMITWNQYFRRLNTAMGLSELNEVNPVSSKLRSAIMQPIRSSAKYLLGHFGDSVMKIYARFDIAKRMIKYTEKSIKTTPTLAELNLYNRNVLYLTSKAQDVLGYTPKFDIDTGLDMSVCWLKHHGMLL